MNYFLAKTDPQTYSMEDFIAEGETLWDGVHNNAALLFIQQMKPGDLVYIYESQSTKAIVGLAEVTTEPALNEADPRRSWACRMKFVKAFAVPLTLATIKATPELAQCKLVRESRLSVMPITDSEQKVINQLLS